MNTLKGQGAGEFVLQSDVTANQTQTRQEVKNAENEVLKLLDLSYNALIDLANLRTLKKLSNSRVSGIARELKELIKVMSIYNY